MGSNTFQFNQYGFVIGGMGAKVLNLNVEEKKEPSIVSHHPVQPQLGFKQIICPLIIYIYIYIYIRVKFRESSIII